MLVTDLIANMTINEYMPLNGGIYIEATEINLVPALCQMNAADGVLIVGADFAATGASVYETLNVDTSSVTQWVGAVAW